MTPLRLVAYTTPPHTRGFCVVYTLLLRCGSRPPLYLFARLVTAHHVCRIRALRLVILPLPALYGCHTHVLTGFVHASLSVCHGYVARGFTYRVRTVAFILPLRCARVRCALRARLPLSPPLRYVAVYAHTILYARARYTRISPLRFAVYVAGYYTHCVLQLPFTYTTYLHTCSWFPTYVCSCPILLDCTHLFHHTHLCCLYGYHHFVHTPHLYGYCLPRIVGSSLQFALPHAFTHSLLRLSLSSLFWFADLFAHFPRLLRVASVVRGYVRLPRCCLLPLDCALYYHTFLPVLRCLLPRTFYRCYTLRCCW